MLASLTQQASELRQIADKEYVELANLRSKLNDLQRDAGIQTVSY
jgi:hypothetical protein